MGSVGMVGGGCGKYVVLVVLVVRDCKYVVLVVVLKVVRDCNNVLLVVGCGCK